MDMMTLALAKKYTDEKVGGGSGGGSGGGIPVVDIQKSIFSIPDGTGEPALLTEEESAQLTALNAENKVIVVNFWENDPDAMNYPIPVLFSLAFYAGEGIFAYTSMFGNSTFFIGFEDGIGMVSKLG